MISRSASASACSGPSAAITISMPGFSVAPRNTAGDPHAARRSAAGDLSHVAAGTLADHLGILRQALLQLRHHRCRRALLRPEHRRRRPTSGLSTSQATSIRHCRRRASSVLRSIPLSVASSPPPHGSALPSGR